MRPTRVLVVEDDADIRESLAQVLEEAGHTVLRAVDGREALELLHRRPRPNVVVVDLMMPVMTGWDLIDRIRSDPDVAALPVIVTSASAGHAPPTADVVLPKPLSIDAVVRAVARFCDEQPAAPAPSPVRELARRTVELVELQRMREELTAMFMHDLKSPLAVMISNLEFVLSGPLDEEPDEKRLALQDVHAAARRMSRVIANLLDVARADAGHLKPAREPVALGALIGELTRRRTPMAAAHKVAIETRLEVEDTIAVDRDQITRVLDNLLDNAFRHTPSGGHIRVSLERTNGGVRIGVANAGLPIPPELRARLFEKFAHGTESRGPNLGLGLYFCKLAVEAHGGRIHLESSPELPTVFVVELPA